MTENTPNSQRAGHDFRIYMKTSDFDDIRKREEDPDERETIELGEFSESEEAPNVVDAAFAELCERFADEVDPGKLWDRVPLSPNKVKGLLSDPAAVAGLGAC